jgi:hypothetical protein
VLDITSSDEYMTVVVLTEENKVDLFMEQKDPRLRNNKKDKKNNNNKERIRE